MEQIVEHLHPLVTLSGGIELFAALISVVLLIGFLCSESMKTTIGKSMIAVLASHAIMQASDGILWFIVDIPHYVPVVKVLSAVSNISWCFMMTAFTYCIVFYIAVRRPVTIKIAHAMACLNTLAALFYLLNYNGMFYYINEAGVYCNGPYLWIHKAIWYIILFANIVFILCHSRYLELKEELGFLSYGVFMVFAAQIETIWDVTPIYIASTISIIWVCILIYMNQSRELRKKEQELAQNRIAIMLSQIQPHFLFNALLVIQELCVINPKEAEQATIEFSRFLRGNLDSLSTDVPIPFSKEIEHTENYLALEQKRFGDKLHVEWEIQTTAFMIPALSLQPIVENAVRYGVTKQKGGGTIRITTEEAPTEYEIIISDDGVGFDVCQTKEDGRTHIGISNVRRRLQEMCDGELDIESRENVGTTARITIPKGGRSA
ncbi:MAG: histidine kinase [bacterium]|nr:histidine kinase [bacterium]